MKEATSSNIFLRLVLGVLLLFPGPVVRADEVQTLTPVADSLVEQGNPNKNNGTQSTLKIQTDSGNNKRAVVRFDLSSIASTAAAKTSIFKMTFTDDVTANRNHAAHRVTGSPQWTETGITWNSRDGATNWTTPGVDFNSTPADVQATGTTSGVTISWTIRSDGTVTNIPQGWLDGSVPNLGLIVKDQVEGTGETHVYGSKEEAQASDRPKLDVHFLQDVTLAAPTPGISEVTWSWTFPTGSSSANYDGALFAKKLGPGASFVFAPADGTAYTVGDDLGNAESLAINTTAFATVSATDENGADSVVLPGTAYTYEASTHDATTITGAASPAPPHYAFGVSSDATTLTGGGANKNWSYKTGATTLAPPGLDPGSAVVTGSNDNKVHSMDSTNGGRRYRPVDPVGTTGGTIQSRPALIPAVSSSTGLEVVYLGAGDGKVYAFRTDTGAKLWESAVLGSSIQGAPAVQLDAFSNASYPHAFDLVVVGTRNTSDTTNNKIVALNGNTGSTVWTFDPGNLDIINSTPVVDLTNNAVWVTSRAGATGTQPSIWKLDTTTTNPAGNLLDSVILTGLATSDRDIDGSPTLNGDGTFLYAITTGGDLVAVDTASPINVFSIDTGAVSGVGFPIPLSNGGNDDVYFSTSGGVHKRIFDRTSKTFSVGWDNLSFTSPSAPIFTPPPLTLFLYVGDGNGRLNKIDPSDGAVLATRDVNLAATVGDPSFDTVSLKLYVGDTSGRIYSFDQF